jgi:hypothetical protein
MGLVQKPDVFFCLPEPDGATSVTYGLIPPVVQLRPNIWLRGLNKCIAEAEQSNATRLSLLAARFFIYLPARGLETSKLGFEL